MESRLAALSLLALIVFAAGCTDTDSSSAAITVEGPEISDSQIYAGSPVRATLTVKNTGNLPAALHYGENGERLLTNYCPDIFTIENFDVSTNGERQDEKIKMQPGREARFSWTLEATESVPSYGLKCPNMDFQAPFNYSVDSYRQVQVKRNSEVEGSSQLASQSSAGPMNFLIETVGGRDSATFLATEQGDKRTVGVNLQLVNTGSEEYAKGLIDVQEESLVIAASEPLQLFEAFSASNCNGDTLEQMNSCVKPSRSADWNALKTYARGPDTRCSISKEDEIKVYEGESRIIRCEVPIPYKSELDKPSQISEVRAKVNYSYIKDLGTRSVRVESRGN